MFGLQHGRIRRVAMEIGYDEMFFRRGFYDSGSKRVLRQIKFRLRLCVSRWIVRNIPQHRSRRHVLMQGLEAAVEICYSKRMAFLQVGVGGNHIQQKPKTGRERDTNQNGDDESMTAQDDQFSIDFPVILMRPLFREIGIQEIDLRFVQSWKGSDVVAQLQRDVARFLVNRPLRESLTVWIAGGCKVHPV